MNKDFANGINRLGLSSVHSFRDIDLGISYIKIGVMNGLELRADIFDNFFINFNLTSGYDLCLISVLYDGVVVLRLWDEGGLVLFCSNGYVSILPDTLQIKCDSETRNYENTTREYFEMAILLNYIVDFHRKVQKKKGSR